MQDTYDDDEYEDNKSSGSRHERIIGGSSTAGMLAASMDIRKFLKSLGTHRMSHEKEDEIAKRGKKKPIT